MAVFKHAFCYEIIECLEYGDMNCRGIVITFFVNRIYSSGNAVQTFNRKHDYKKLSANGVTSSYTGSACAYWRT